MMPSFAVIVGSRNPEKGAYYVDFGSYLRPNRRSPDPAPGSTPEADSHLDRPAIRNAVTRAGHRNVAFAVGNEPRRQKILKSSPDKCSTKMSAPSAWLCRPEGLRCRVSPKEYGACDILCCSSGPRLLTIPADLAIIEFPIFDRSHQFDRNQSMLYECYGT